MRLPRRASLLLPALWLLTWAATAHAKGAWVLWKHSYEVWVDSNKVDHRRDVAWKKVAATAAKSDCEDRGVNEARAEYGGLTGRGIEAIRDLKWESTGGTRGSRKGTATSRRTPPPRTRAGRRRSERQENT